MTTIKPLALKKGDTIGLISPSSPTSSFEWISKGVGYLERLGYQVKLCTNLNKKYGYLAGTDEERVADIHEMFSDKSVKAIFGVRGGYGTPRLLPLINYSLIKKNPKILVGYSDITALQLAIYKKTGVVTFSGPMLAVDMWKEMDPYTEENFWTIVTSKKKLGKIHNLEGKEYNVLQNGSANGRLIGGNLSLIVSLVGTQYLPSFRNSILFFEEIGEECYRVDRMLNQLKLSNILSNLKGTLIGDLSEIKPSDPSKPYLSVNQILQHYFPPYKKPVIQELPFGHIPTMMTMPIGLRASINTNKNSISFEEAAVT